MSIQTDVSRPSVLTTYCVPSNVNHQDELSEVQGPLKGGAAAPRSEPRRMFISRQMLKYTTILMWYPRRMATW